MALVDDALSLLPESLRSTTRIESGRLVCAEGQDETFGWHKAVAEVLSAHGWSMGGNGHYIAAFGPGPIGR